MIFTALRCCVVCGIVSNIAHPSQPPHLQRPSIRAFNSIISCGSSPVSSYAASTLYTASSHGQLSVHIPNRSLHSVPQKCTQQTPFSCLVLHRFVNRSMLILPHANSVTLPYIYRVLLLLVPNAFLNSYMQSEAILI